MGGLPERRAGFFRRLGRPYTIRREGSKGFEKGRRVQRGGTGETDVVKDNVFQWFGFSVRGPKADKSPS